jgi:hypoxanthine-DNA glycosylase
MDKVETHPHVAFCPPGATTLILGSFPCFNGIDYGDWFYSGSGRNEFWRLLSDTFHLPANNLEQKKKLVIDHKIALSDVAYRIIRTKNNCSDSNLLIVEDNRPGIESCLLPTISRVLFTGRFVERKFQKLFPELAIPTEVLLSPSPAANRYVGSLPDYKEKLLRGEVRSVYEYKLQDYRSKLLRDGLY